MEPRRFVDGSGKHRRRMVDSTAEGRLVGPGEKLRTLDDGQLAGGVSEPWRAGWLGSILSAAADVIMVGCCCAKCCCCCSSSSNNANEPV